MLYKGFGFPKENELLYKFGILKTYKESIGGGKGGSTTITVTSLVDNNNKFVDFDCSYTVLPYPSTCFSEKEFKEYRNQSAKIGYYYQKDFLWLKNPLPQIVTLEVNGSQIWSYQSTKQKIKKDNKVLLYIIIALNSFIVIVWLVFELTFRQSLKNA